MHTVRRFLPLILAHFLVSFVYINQKQGLSYKSFTKIETLMSSQFAADLRQFVPTSIFHPVIIIVSSITFSQVCINHSLSTNFVLMVHV